MLTGSRRELQKVKNGERFGSIHKITLHKASDLMHVTVGELLKWLPDHLACRRVLSFRPIPQIVQLENVARCKFFPFAPLLYALLELCEDCL